MNKASFHHIHLNVTDIEATISFYQKFFGAKHIKYRDSSDALFTERSFLLMDQMEIVPPTHLGTCLWHIGWSGVDGPSEYAWRLKEGIEVHTPINPLGDAHWMYFLGPDKEVVEVFTGNRNHTFEHIHLLASDVDETTEWFETYLGLVPEFKKAQPWGNGLFKWNKLFVDNINIMINGKPKEERTWYPKNGFKSTYGTTFDHIGFSFRNIYPVYDKMQSRSVAIIKDVKLDTVHGLKSFFVQGPDGLGVEIVEEKPIPSGIWQ
ncbi:VOC family protein [Ulvibacterium sp.]|uniref:VOC family protein n=1 Tax=Ulvibacterium sp. TaxID=2665914 RepID=UPI003BA85DA6